MCKKALMPDNLAVLLSVPKAVGMIWYGVLALAYKQSIGLDLQITVTLCIGFGLMWIVAILSLLGYLRGCSMDANDGEEFVNSTSKRFLLRAVCLFASTRVAFASTEYLDCI